MSATPGAAVLTRAFAAEVLAREGQLWCAVRTSSMAPLLRPGDRVLAVPTISMALRPGAILAVDDDDRILVHRLIAITPAGLVLKGDALPWADAAIESASVIGRIVAVEREGRLRGLRSGYAGALAAVVARYSRVLARAPLTRAPATLHRLLRLPLHAAALAVHGRPW